MEAWSVGASQQTRLGVTFVVRTVLGETRIWPAESRWLLRCQFNSYYTALRFFVCLSASLYHLLYPVDNPRERSVMYGKGEKHKIITVSINSYKD
jgi:hypothetical protein